MKERPILFSAPMVRALLAGTKTQTRRAIKPQPVPQAGWVGGGYWERRSATLTRPIADRWSLRDMLQFCPYGAPGDRLWVREAWARTKIAQDATGADVVVYREGDYRTDYGGPWKPGIHMFRRDSRITLEVTEVRVERLQDISEADALAEGVLRGYEGFHVDQGSHFHAADPRQSYLSLWEAINGPGSVEANPWVWCVSFRRV